jgi:hypothetical protein
MCGNGNGAYFPFLLRPPQHVESAGREAAGAEPENVEDMEIVGAKFAQALMDRAAHHTRPKVLTPVVVQCFSRWPGRTS